MSFGDLLGLVLFLVFIVLPAVNRMQRRGPGAPPGPPGAPQPGAPGRAAGPPRPTAPAAGPQPTAFPPVDDDDLARRLEAARERVRRAIEGRSAGSPEPAPTPPPSRVGGTGDPKARAARPLVASDRDDGLMSTPVPPQPPLAARPRPQRPQGAARPPAARDLRAHAPQVEIERLDERSGRRAGASTLLAFDAQSVRDGLLWHQVLGAPRARRRLGGGPFQER